MADLPPEADKLLAVGTADFVAARGKIARVLRDAGRAEDARAVAGLRKPPAVVLAVNRAARDRPQIARDAAAAATRVAETQLAGDTDEYRGAARDLESALDLLAEVGVAHVAPPGKRATEAMRRRVRGLLRNAVADETGRAALVRGVLTEEREASGFASFAGMAVPATSKRKGSRKRPQRSPSDEKRRQREKALREELTQAERALRSAEREVERATLERDRAEKAVTSVRAKLDRH